MWQILGMAGAFVVLSAYLTTALTKNVQYLNWANFLTAWIMVPANIAFGVLFGALIALAFGIIGLIGICIDWKQRWEAKSTHL
jgi:hypothetical protein